MPASTWVMPEGATEPRPPQTQSLASLKPALICRRVPARPPRRSDRPIGRRFRRRTIRELAAPKHQLRPPQMAGRTHILINLRRAVSRGQTPVAVIFVARAVVCSVESYGRPKNFDMRDVQFVPVADLAGMPDDDRSEDVIPIGDRISTR